uniref:Uncharacterized protein n=1 Tax=Timema tahoe TaxID=61484 RepID=A0A7R9P0Q7_9NEOP|nr:unnamed protein product [Timema tahoe]
MQNVCVECSKSLVPDAYLVAIQEADQFLTMLHDFSAMGAAMRRVMTGALTNPQIYKHLTECQLEGSDYQRYMIQSQDAYKKAVNSLPSPEPPDEYKERIHRLQQQVLWCKVYFAPEWCTQGISAGPAVILIDLTQRSEEYIVSKAR